MKTRFNGVLIAAIVSLLAAAPRASACAACFGKSDSTLAQGMNMGILALLGFIGLVMAGVVSFFVYVAKRTAAHEALEAMEDATDESPTDIL